VAYFNCNTSELDEKCRLLTLAESFGELHGRKVSTTNGAKSNGKLGAVCASSPKKNEGRHSRMSAEMTGAPLPLQVENGERAPLSDQTTPFNLLPPLERKCGRARSVGGGATRATVPDYLPLYPLRIFASGELASGYEEASI
jgi:hypothetical protein